MITKFTMIYKPTESVMVEMPIQQPSNEFGQLRRSSQIQFVHESTWVDPCSETLEDLKPISQLVGPNYKSIQNFAKILEDSLDVYLKFKRPESAASGHVVKLKRGLNLPLNPNAEKPIVAQKRRNSSRSSYSLDSPTYFEQSKKAKGKKLEHEGTAIILSKFDPSSNPKHGIISSCCGDDFNLGKIQHIQETKQTQISQLPNWLKSGEGVSKDINTRKVNQIKPRGIPIWLNEPSEVESGNSSKACSSINLAHNDSDTDHSTKSLDCMKLKKVRSQSDAPQFCYFKDARDLSTQMSIEARKNIFYRFPSKRGYSFSCLDEQEVLAIIDRDQRNSNLHANEEIKDIWSEPNKKISDKFENINRQSSRDSDMDTLSDQERYREYIESKIGKIKRSSVVQFVSQSFSEDPCNEEVSKLDIQNQIVPAQRAYAYESAEYQSDIESKYVSGSEKYSDSRMLNIAGDKSKGDSDCEKSNYNEKLHDKFSRQNINSRHRNKLYDKINESNKTGYQNGARNSSNFSRQNLVKHRVSHPRRKLFEKHSNLPNGIYNCSETSSWVDSSIELTPKLHPPARSSKRKQSDHLIYSNIDRQLSSNCAKTLHETDQSSIVYSKPLKEYRPTSSSNVKSLNQTVQSLPSYSNPFNHYIQSQSSCSITPLNESSELPTEYSSNIDNKFHPKKKKRSHLTNSPWFQAIKKRFESNQKSTDNETRIDQISKTSISTGKASVDPPIPTCRALKTPSRINRIESDRFETFATPNLEMSLYSQKSYLASPPHCQMETPKINNDFQIGNKISQSQASKNDRLSYSNIKEQTRRRSSTILDRIKGMPRKASATLSKFFDAPKRDSVDATAQTQSSVDLTKWTNESPAHEAKGRQTLHGNPHLSYELFLTFPKSAQDLIWDEMLVLSPREFADFSECFMKDICRRRLTSDLFNKSRRIRQLIALEKANRRDVELQRAGYAGRRYSKTKDHRDRISYNARTISETGGFAGANNSISKTSPTWKKMDVPKTDDHSPLKDANRWSALQAPVRMNTKTVKDLLLKWCQSKTAEYDNIEICNFSSSWADGMAFCALIHHFYPLSFDFASLNPKNRADNLDLAFKTAESEADIAPLLEVEDMIYMGDKPDYKCIFTYVQSMYNHLKNHD